MTAVCEASDWPSWPYGRACSPHWTSRGCGSSTWPLSWKLGPQHSTSIHTVEYRNAKVNYIYVITVKCAGRFLLDY